MYGAVEALRSSTELFDYIVNYGVGNDKIDNEILPCLGRFAGSDMPVRRELEAAIQKYVGSDQERKRI